MVLRFRTHLIGRNPPKIQQQDVEPSIVNDRRSRTSRVWSKRQASCGLACRCRSTTMGTKSGESIYGASVRPRPDDGLKSLPAARTKRTSQRPNLLIGAKAGASRL